MNIFSEKEYKNFIEPTFGKDANQWLVLRAISEPNELDELCDFCGEVDCECNNDSK